MKIFSLVKMEQFNNFLESIFHSPFFSYITPLNLSVIIIMHINMCNAVFCNCENTFALGEIKYHTTPVCFLELLWIHKSYQPCAS